MAYMPNYNTYGQYNNPYNSYPYQQQFYPQQAGQMPTQQPQPQQQQAQGQAQMPNVQQTINSGFVRVQSEEEARRYPVAPGGSVTFIDENAPYCYTKSVDFSQLDRPTFKKFRLVEETGEPQKQEEPPKEQVNFATVADFETLQKNYSDLKSEIEELWDSFENLSTKIEIKKSVSKKEDK